VSDDYAEMIRRLLSEDFPPEDLAAFGERVHNSVRQGAHLFPLGDSEDFASGATHIPGEVTDARRGGQTVTFHHEGADSSKWYWQLPDGTKINHG
jgi:hypothetical protein